jgi:hypothetical protein
MILSSSKYRDVGLTSTSSAELSYSHSLRVIAEITAGLLMLTSKQLFSPYDKCWDAEPTDFLLSRAALLLGLPRIYFYWNQYS